MYCYIEKIVMRYILCLVLACMMMAEASAQTRAVVRKMFQEGKYEEAKPLFKKLLKANPRNSEYSFWYAACCLETGDTADVRSLLEFAVSRKIVNAHRYLGDYHFVKMNYPLAVECYDEFLDLTKDDSLKSLFQRKLNQAAQLERMVNNCYRICVIDSVVVDKSKFLSAYRMGNDVGVISSCADFFDDELLPGYAYGTERGLDVFFSDTDDDSGLLKLYANSRVGDDWGSAAALKGFDTKGNDDYPFMLSDGVTLYFASDGESSIGGYDIFVSRFDVENSRFLRPDNMGMPFNSIANDYMMAVNEVANIGWFASDRNQPEGKVCVYVFIPDPDRKKYNSQALGYDRMLAYSLISSIADTWGDEDAVMKARRQLVLLANARENDEDSNTPVFIIDDVREYRGEKDFRSAEARSLFKKWQVAVRRNRDNIGLLDRKREEYSSANAGMKEKMSAGILALEAEVEEEADALRKMEYEIRRLEQEAIYR